MLIYFLLHFIWAASDHLKENKLRFTGVVIPMVQQGMSFGGTHDLHPNTDQEKYSTIFSWWYKERGKVDGHEQLVSEITKSINLEQHEQALSRIQQDLDSINHKSSYIEESLIRFEQE